MLISSNDYCRSNQKNVILRLYKQHVRPQLEHAVQAWSPWLQKDIKILARQIIPKLQHYNYQNRLKQLGLITLEQRGIHGNMIQLQN